MKRILLIMVLLWLTAGGVHAEQVVQVDVSSLQAAADEAGAPLNAVDLLKAFAQGSQNIDLSALREYVSGIAREELPALRTRLIMLMSPAVLWAVNRHLLGGGELSETAGFVCFLCGACVLLDMVGEYIVLVRNTMQRTSALTAQFFPILGGLLSASGAPGRASAVSPLVTLLGGALNVFLQRAVSVLSAGAAVTAAAGNLTERVSLQGLFRLFCTAGNWLMGGIMAAFAALLSFGGVVGSAHGGIAMRAVKYAVGTLLPLVGGEVAGEMDVLSAGASAVCSAAGVTGVIVMLVLCLRPFLRLISGMLCCMLASALIEPIADGALRRCMDQISQVMRLLLAASSVNAVLFIVLTGTLCAV